MTSRQKQIVAILAIANLVIILALSALMLPSSGIGPLPFLAPETEPPTPNRWAPTPIGRTGWPETPALERLPQETCRLMAAQMLAQASLGGAVTWLPDGSLRFEIAYSAPPGQTPDDAAQLVWNAFDIALALHERKCAFSSTEVVISDRDRLHRQLNARVSVEDLAALGAGKLSENRFIERVTYTISQLPQ